MFAEEESKKSFQIEDIISIIARKCRSDLGIAYSVSLPVASDMAELKKRQQLFFAVENYRLNKGELPWQQSLSSAVELTNAASETGLLNGAELVKIRKLLKLATEIRTALAAGTEDFPELSDIVRNIYDFSELLAEFGDAFDEDGRLYDKASDKLFDIRQKLRGTRESIRSKGQSLLNSAYISEMLRERMLVMRNFRHAFIVKQEYLGKFPGIVVDRSGSGNSVYMEHSSLVRLNNEFSILKNKENDEEIVILRKLTEKLLRCKKQIMVSERTLGMLDLFYAMSEIVRLKKWNMPQLSDKAYFKLMKAKHPLLFDSAVPINIECGKNFKTLVVTGPNTGGKTVSLKTVGVCIILAWLGMPIPADKDSVIGNFDKIFADIGDEQSIEQSLSTFSAHIKHMTSIIKNCTSSSIVMLDELGSGTDPDEGAALGIAVLDKLLNNKVTVLATTHHNPIKHYATSAKNVETASVEFDIETLSPTYKLLIGVPGQSNAILIAKKLGMPEDVLRRAQKALSDKEVSMESIIGELYKKQANLDKKIAEYDNKLNKLEAQKSDYEQKTKRLEEKKEEMLADADKKAVSIVKNAENSARALIKNIENAKAESDARRELEKKRSHFTKIENSAIKREDKKQSKLSVSSTKTELEPGDVVQIIGTNNSATVIEIEGKNASVQAGVMRIQVPLTKLKFVHKKETKPAENNVRVEVARPVGVPMSIMIRHMTVDEATPVVEQYLDRAYRAGYETVTVIHGRGEGILRREVHEICKRTPYVSEYTLGDMHEGGHGVTVVKFKK